MEEFNSGKSVLVRLSNLFQDSSVIKAILLSSLGLTIAAAWLSYYYSKNSAEQRFNMRTHEIVSAIKFRMLYYEQALWSCVGLYNSLEEVSREDFQKFVETLSVERHLPGIQGIGFSVPVSPEQKESHIMQIREEGFSDYTIKPEGERDQYSAIIYLEPFDWRNQRAFGYDMWSNEMRREAMDRAVRTGKASNSGIITLVQETENDIQKGFLMYLPVYRKNMPIEAPEARNAAFKGWVYSPFRAGDLMHGILSEEDLEYEIEVYDGNQPGKDFLLFDSDSVYHREDNKHKPSLNKLVSIDLQGRNWSLYIHTKSSDLTRKEGYLPLVIGICGLIIDVALFLAIYSLNRLQRKTRNLASSLEIQKAEIENANKELAQFAYIASHDLQEPLRTVTNYVQAIEEDYGDKLDEEGKGFLNIVTDATTRMINLINAILEYSRLGKTKLEAETIDCNLLLEEIRMDMETLINETQTKLEVMDLPIVIGERELLRQVFINLITNAIKYRKPGLDPVVTVKGVDKSSFYEFSISDNGIGIENKYLDRIFEIFKRLHTKEQYSGTGIGLSSCKKIVEIHQGNMTVASQPGEGSTFTFTISKRKSWKK